MGKVSASRAAKLLGVSVEDVRVLEEKGLLHSGSPEEIARIKAKKGMTVAEAAGLVDAEIQRKTVSSVSLFQKVLRVIGGFLAGYIALVMVAGIFFLTYPLQASDFFGYYYRYNAPEKNGKVLAAATGPVAVPYHTSVLADVLKPAVAMSLVAVKAVDSQKYVDIVTPPVQAAAALGAPAAVVAGPQGPAGLTGANGANGVDGVDGTNGTSVADILTTSGGIIIRDGTNTTVQLDAGLDGQVLTIFGGIPAWKDSTVSGLTVSNFASPNLSQWANDSGYLVATDSSLTVSAGTGLSGGGLVSLGGTTTLSLPNVGASGTYGSAAQVPVLTTDAQGRITGVANTAITGFLTTETDTLASVTGRGATTSAGLTLNGGVTTTATTALTLDSGTTGGISIGTGATAKTITLGNTTGTTTLNLNAGSGGIILGGVAAQTNGKLVLCIDGTTHKLFFGNSQTACNSSSERYKHNITDVTLGLDAVNVLRPVSYNYNSDNEPSLGFVAEEAQKVDERLVVRDQNGVIQAVDPSQFIPILTKGIQQLDLKVNGMGVSIASNSANTLPAAVAGTQTLKQDILSQVADMIAAIYNTTAEFFNNVIFHSDVVFLGRPIFNQDTAGFAYIGSGQNEVLVNFDKEYVSVPVVTANVNLVGAINVADIPSYAIYDPSTKGFKIKLGRTTGSDLQFSWVALSVKDAKTTQGQVGGVSTSVPPPTVPAAESTPPASESANPPTLEIATQSAQTATPSTEIKD